MPIPTPPPFPGARPAPESVSETQTFRPQRRPPVGMLCVLDDGRTEGEWLRLRGDRFVMGRTEGDLVLPHDPGISPRHAELTRGEYKGAYVWYLTDLESQFGTFVRVNKAILEPGQELLLSGQRYRFDSPLDRVQASAVSGDPDEQQMSTYRWLGDSPRTMIPYLLELTEQGEGKVHDMSQLENWVGRDPQQVSVVLRDPAISPRHACLQRDPKGRWTVEDNKTLNGTWVRVQQLRIKGTAQFQLGEQRFFFKLTA